MDVGPLLASGEPGFKYDVADGAVVSADDADHAELCMTDNVPGCARDDVSVPTLWYGPAVGIAAEDTGTEARVDVIEDVWSSEQLSLTRVALADGGVAIEIVEIV